MSNASKVIAGLVLVAVAAGPARADIVNFSPDGSSPALSLKALNFAAGNAVAENGDAIAKGSTIQLLFQATLSSVTLANNSQFTPTGLNASGGYQITIVASLTETVTNVFSNPTTATFALSSVQAPNSFVELYYNPAIVNNAAAGTGFNVGTQILSGTPTPSMASSGSFSFSESSPGVPVIQPFNQSGSSTFPNVNTVVGSGSASIGALINQATLNHAFFTDPNPIKQLVFNAVNSTPFVGVDPSKLFADMPGGVPPGLHAQPRLAQRIDQRGRDRFPVPVAEQHLVLRPRAVGLRPDGHRRRRAGRLRLAGPGAVPGRVEPRGGFSRILIARRIATVQAARAAL